MGIEPAIQQAAIDHAGLKRNPQYSTRFTYSPASRYLVFFEVIKDTLFVATVFHGAINIKEKLDEEMMIIQREIDEIK